MRVSILLFLGLRHSALHYIGPFEEIPWLASKCAAQFIENVRAKHPGVIVIERKQGGIADTRFLPQAVQRPSLLLEDFGEPTENHAGNLARPRPSMSSYLYMYCILYTRALR